MLKTLRLPVRFAVGFVFLVACVASVAWAQVFPPTLDVRVTFYDFRSDRSNPEFEQPHLGGLRAGMVQALLDSDGKPLPTQAQNNVMNQGVRFWFRDWSRIPASEKFRPIYMYRHTDGAANTFTEPPPGVRERVDATGIWGAPGMWREGNTSFRWDRNATGTSVTIGGKTYSVENAYENRVIEADLRFIHVGGREGYPQGTYQFARDNRFRWVNGRCDDDAGFFPLNDLNVNVSYPNGNEVIFPATRLDGTPNNRPFPTSSDNWVSSSPWNDDQGRCAPAVGTRNYSFTMEMVTTFKMEPNLIFDFTGDDDVWLFINRRLVTAVDLGGIHEQVTGRVNLENIRNTHDLQDGREYDFHLFYAERHSDESNIRITTNIVSAIVTGLKIEVDGEDMVAGERKVASALVEVDIPGGGRYQDFSNGTFTWEVRDESGLNTIANGNLSVTNASTDASKSGQGHCGANTTGSPLNQLCKTDSIYVTANLAHTYIWIKGTYTQAGMLPVTDSVRVWVGPAAPAAVFIEGSSSLNSSTASLNTPNPIGTISISPTQTSVNNFYAILRDRFGNWIGPAFTHTSGNVVAPGRVLSWTTEVPAIATATSAPNPGGQYGQGQATRVADQGRTPLTATYTINGAALTPGAAVIEIEDVVYTGIAIGVNHGGTFIELARTGCPPAQSGCPGGTLTMISGTDTTLHVYMRRSTDGAWVQVSEVTWNINNIPGVTAPSGTPDRHTLRPTGATSNGTVNAAWSANPALFVLLNVTVVDQDAVAMRFFTRKGTPDVQILNEYILPGGLPATARMYPAPPAVMTVTAGARLPIVPKMFSSLAPSAATWLDYDGPGNGGATWTWSRVPGSPGTDTIISAATGDSIMFRSTTAHNTYQIRAVFTRGSATVTQDLHIRVVPDITDPRLYIEPPYNGQGLSIAPNSAENKIDVLDFTINDTRQSVNAILRDQYGNFIAEAGNPNNMFEFRPQYTGDNVKPTVWTPTEAENKIVAASNGYVQWGEGLIDKREPGSPVWVYAVDPTYNKRDSMLVRILDYYYIDVEIAVRCDAPAGGPGTVPGNPGYCFVTDTLRFTTNDDVEIFVFGQRDDETTWELVTGSWSRDADLVGALPTTPPTGVNNWLLSPRATGRGTISVSRPGSGGVMLTDIIDVVITVGPPNRAEVVVITPPEERKAGAAIQLEVRYYNRAGLMDGWNPLWTSPAGSYFADTLGMGTTTKEPEINTAARGDDILFYLGTPHAKRNNAVLSVESGIATFTVTLYYAADGHRIRYEEILNIGNGQFITAISDPFTVLPGDPHSLVIVPEGKEQNIVNDTLKLRFGDDGDRIILCAQASDAYGNIIGCFASDWTTPQSETGVPEIDVNGRPLVAYELDKAESNGNDVICAVIPGATNAGGQPLRDCIEIRVDGVIMLPDAVITRDYNGCGYLDAIELKFRKPVELVDGRVWVSKGASDETIRAVRGSTIILADSVTISPNDPTLAIIWLRENRSSGELQTGWTPTLQIGAGVFIDAGVRSAGQQAMDGAAPVISRARVFFPPRATGKVSDNYIDVEFSEDIRSSTNRSFRDVFADYKPADLFNIWTVGSSQGKRTSWMSRRRASNLAKMAHDPNEEGHNYIREPNALDGIANVIYVSDNTLRFYLENERELGPPRHHMNIRTDALGMIAAAMNEGVHIWDVPQNKPQDNNRKVPITYGVPPGDVAKPIPNPARPDQDRVPGGQISANHDAGAIEHIKSGGGGTVFEVPIYVPNSTGSFIRCQLKVYDLAGNLVISGESNKAREDFLNNQGEFTKMHIYWNGFNSKAMAVAPGTYRMVVHISYGGNLTTSEDRQFAKNKKLQGLVGISK